MTMKKKFKKINKSKIKGKQPAEPWSVPVAVVAVAVADQMEKKTVQSFAAAAAESGLDRKAVVVGETGEPDQMVGGAVAVVVDQKLDFGAGQIVAVAGVAQMIAVEVVAADQKVAEPQRTFGFVRRIVVRMIVALEKKVVVVVVVVDAAVQKDYVVVVVVEVADQTLGQMD